MESNAVTEHAHEVVAVEPEADGESRSSVRENPDWDCGLGRGNVGLPDGEDGGEWTDGVGDIVGTMGKGGGRCGQNLEEGVGVLGLVVVVWCGIVDALEVTDEQGVLSGGAISLVLGDILINTMHNNLACVIPDILWSVEWLIWVASADLWLGHDWCSLVNGSGLWSAESLLNIVLGVASHDTSGGRVGGGWLDVFWLEILVVVDDDLVALWLLWDLTAAEEERTLEDIVPSELPVLLDKNAVKVWKEEEGGKESKSSSNTEDCTADLAGGEIWECLGPLPDDQHGKNGGSDTEVDRNHEESIADWVRAFKDSVLRDGEDDGTKASGNQWSNTPGGEDLCDTAPSPVNSLSSNGCDTHADDTSHDRVGGGDWKTDAGSEREVDGGGDEGAGHSQHENSWVGLEEVDWDNLGLDGVGDTATNTNGTGELAYRSQDHGLLKGDGMGRDGCGPRVCNIVRTLSRC